MIHTWLKHFSWVVFYSLLSHKLNAKGIPQKTGPSNSGKASQPERNRDLRSVTIRSVKDALQMVYSYSIEINSSYIDLKKALEYCFKTKSDWFPNIDLILKSTFNPSRGPGIQNTQTIENPNEQFFLSKNRNKNAQAFFNINQNIYNGGATKAKNAFAYEAYAEAWCEFNMTVQNTFFNTLESFLTMAVARENYLIAKMREKSLSMLREIARKRSLAGDVRMGDVALANAQCINKSIEVNNAKKAYLEAKTNLEAYIGMPVSNQIEFPAPLDVPMYSLQGFFDLCLKGYPAYKKSLHIEKKMRHRVTESGAEFLPRIDFSIQPTVGDSYNLQENIGLQNSYTQNSTASILAEVTVRTPIFDGGNRQAQYRTTELELKGVRLATEKQRRELFAACKNIHRAIQIALQNVVSAREALKEQGAVYSSAREEYALGATTMVDLLGLEEQYAQAVTRLIEALAEMVRVSYRFRVFSGDLTPANISKTGKNYQIDAYRKEVKSTLFTFGKNQEKAPLYEKDAMAPAGAADGAAGSAALEKGDYALELDIQSALKEGVEWYPDELTLQDQEDVNPNENFDPLDLANENNDDLSNLSDLEKNQEIQALMKEALAESASYLEDEGTESQRPENIDDVLGLNKENNTAEKRKSSEKTAIKSGTEIKSKRKQGNGKTPVAKKTSKIKESQKGSSDKSGAGPVSKESKAVPKK